MHKKSTIRLFLLIPIIALILAITALLATSYPNTLLNIETMLSQGRSENTSDDPSAYLVEELKKLDERINEKLRLLQEREPELAINKARELLRCTVKIEVGNSTGTGIVVYENIINDLHYTYIVTNCHVVDNANEVGVLRYKYLNNGAVSSTTRYTGKVIEREASIDLALIEIQTPDDVGPTASFVSTDLSSELTVYQKVYVFGCPLGNAPLITIGNIADIKDSKLIITAFSIFGTSGGGAFDAQGKLIGLVSGVAGLQLANNVRVPEGNITHVIPTPLIVSWLIVKDYKFIIGDGSHEEYITKRPLLLENKKP